MSELTERWVPRRLISEHQLKRVDISRILLTCFQANPKNFHHELTIQDETWVYHSILNQSKLKKHSGSPFPKKFKLTASIGKVVASAIWDSDGVIIIDYLEKGKIVYGQYYALELR